jgi:hypothetical protein
MDLKTMRHYSKYFCRWVAALSDPQGETPVPSMRHSNWMDSIPSLAAYHGTAPAVRRNLVSAGLDVPEELNRLCLRQAGQGMVLRRFSQQIMQRLSAAGLPGVIIKGPSLGEAVYPDAGDRVFGDVDLLVPKAAMAEVRAELCAMGASPVALGSLRHESSLYGEEGLVMPSPSGVNIPIDLHWNLVNSPAIQKGISLEYKDVVSDEVLSLEAQLLIVIVHGSTHHQFDRLRLLVDLLQVLRAGDQQFYSGALADRLRQTHTVAPLAAASYLLKSLFGYDGGLKLLRELGLASPTLADRCLLSPSWVITQNPSWGLIWRSKWYRQLLKCG